MPNISVRDAENALADLQFTEHAWARLWQRIGHPNRLYEFLSRGVKLYREPAGSLLLVAGGFTLVLEGHPPDYNHPHPYFLVVTVRERSWRDDAMVGGMKTLHGQFSIQPPYASGGIPLPYEISLQKRFSLKDVVKKFFLKLAS